MFGGSRLAPMRPKTSTLIPNKPQGKNDQEENRTNNNAKIIIPNDPDMQLSIHFYEFVVGAVIVHLLCEN